MDKLARRIHAATVTVVAAALLIGVTAGLNAENLMVYIEARDPNQLERLDDDEKQLKVDYFLSAIEAGIMDAFFEADYVVFNAGPVSGADEIGRRSEAHVLTVAQEGGADLLIRLAVRFDTDGNGAPEPGLGELAVYQVDGAEEILSHRVRLAELVDGELELSGEVGFKIGTAIAQRVLENS